MLAVISWVLTGRLIAIHCFTVFYTFELHGSFLSQVFKKTQRKKTVHLCC